MAEPIDAAPRPKRRAAADFLWLLLGLALGIGLGLTYAWLVAPVEFVDATPSELGPADQDAYVVLVSAGYAQDRDLARAQALLSALALADPPAAVAAQLEAAVRAQQSPTILRNLAQLARALGARTATISAFAPASVAPPVQNAGERTASGPRATAVPLAQTVPAPTAPALDPVQAAVRLVEQAPLCDPAAARLEVELLGPLRVPLAGVEVEVVWPGGRDRFLTGLKPERGAGYADFSMQPDVEYAVIIPAGGARVDGLQLEPCDSGQPGGWRLVFQRVGG